MLANKNHLAPGDLIVFNKLLSEYDMDHIGIVVDRIDNILTCSEGNIEDKPILIDREINSNINSIIRIGGIND